MSKVPLYKPVISKAAAEQGMISPDALKAFRNENGSSQGQTLALTGLCIPNFLDCGLRTIKTILIERQDIWDGACT
jgi:hypothetical protein